MKLGIFVTHPIQYFAPIWRGLAAEPWIDLTVHFFSDHSIRGGLDAEFGVPVAWDVPLVEGYRAEFISRNADLSRPMSVQMPDAVDFLRRKQFDAVMIHGYNVRFERQIAAAARKLGIAVLQRGDFTDSIPYHGRSFPKRLMRWAFLKWFYANRVDVFCNVGVEAREHLLGYGVSPSRIFYAPYSVDDAYFRRQQQYFKRDECRASLGIEPDGVVVMFSGKLIPRKAPLLLVDAVTRLRAELKIYLLMVGDGELAAAIEQRARPRLGSRLLMQGFINQSELGRYFCAADLFVLPSEYETWGLVVNEAMQFGLPCITSDRVGCRRDLIIEGKTGFTFPTGDVAALEHYIEKLAASRELRSEMSAAARHHIEGYSTQAAVQGIIQALKKLEADRSPSIRQNT